MRSERSVRRHLAAQSTVIAALMRRLGIESTSIESAEMIDALVELDVERDGVGDMTRIAVRTPCVIDGGRDA